MKTPPDKIGIKIRIIDIVPNKRRYRIRRMLQLWHPQNKTR